MMYFMEKIQLLLSNKKALDAIKRVTYALGSSFLSGGLDYHSPNEKTRKRKSSENAEFKTPEPLSPATNLVNSSLSPKQVIYLAQRKEEFQFRIEKIKNSAGTTETPPKIDNILEVNEQKSKQLSANKKAEIRAQDDD